MAQLLVKCCAKHCKHREALQHALNYGTPFPSIPASIVEFQCTKCGMTTMHQDCYSELESKLWSHLTANKRLRLKPSDILKCIWDQGRTGLYKHVLQSYQQLITCECGGTLCAMTNGRGNVCGVEEDMKTNEKRQKKKEKQKISPMWQPDFSRLDSEQKKYIYRRSYRRSLNAEHDVAVEQTLPSLADFPELLPTPNPNDASVSKHQKYIPLPNMTIKGYRGFHVLTIDKDQTTLFWRPKVIGKGGSGIKALRAKYPDIKRIHIDTTVSGDTERIVIEGGSQESRLDCTLDIKHDIQKIIQKHYGSE